MEADAGGPVVMDPFVVGADRIRGVGLLDLIGSSAFGAPSLGSTLGVGPNSLTSLTGGANYGTGGPNIRIGGREVIGRSDIEGSNTTMVRDPFTGEVTPLPSGVIDLGTTPTGLTQGSADLSDRIQQAIATRESVLGRRLTDKERTDLVNVVFDANTTPGRNLDLTPQPGSGGSGQGGLPILLPLPVSPGVAAGITLAGALLGSGGGSGPTAPPTAPPAGAQTPPATTPPSTTPTTPTAPPEGTNPPVILPTGSTKPGSTTQPPSVINPPEPTTPSTVGPIIIPTAPPGTIGQPTTPAPVAPPTTPPAPTIPPQTRPPTEGGSSTNTGGPLIIPTAPPTRTTTQPPANGNINITFPVATPITVRDPGLNREILREGRISAPAMREIAGSTLSSYGMLGGQPGMADIQSFQNLLGQVGAYNPELTRIASEQTIAANRAQREANIGDVQRLSQAAMEAQRAANPELYSTLGTYLPAATGMLATDLERLQGAGRLSAEDVRMAQQSAREASLARGREMDMSGVAAEVLNRDALARQRQNEARANVQQSMQNVYGGIGAAQAATFNPFAALLGQQYGMQTSNVGLNQALFGQGTGFSSGALSNQFVQGLLNPYSAYAADVYGSNFNAANARAIAEANANAAAQGAEARLIGGLAGTTLNYAIPSFLDIFKSPTPVKTNPIT